MHVERPLMRARLAMAAALAVGTALAGAGLAGCAQQEPAAAPSVVTVTAAAPSPEPSPSVAEPSPVEPSPSQPEAAETVVAAPAEPVTLTYEEAAVRYEELAAVRNFAVCQVNQVANWDEQTRPELQRLAGQAADASRQFGLDINSTAWPDDLQPQFDELTVLISGEIDYYRGLSEAATVEEMLSIDEAYFAALPVSNPGQNIRLRLGLPEARLEC